MGDLSFHYFLDHWFVWAFRNVVFMSASATVAEAIAPPSPPENRPRRWFPSRWLSGLVLVLIPALGWGGYLGWHWFQSRSFRQQCEAARIAEDWRFERQIAGQWAAWDPDAGRAWWYAAEAAQNLEDYEDLADCLGQVPKSDPKALIALVEKANLEWTALNRPMSAIQTSQQILAIEPRITEIQSRVISFYAMNLQRAPMLKAIRAAMTIGSEPKESYPYLVMADILTFSNGEKLNSRWLASAPDEIRFKVALAVHMSMNFTQSAEAGESPEVIELHREAKQQLQWFLDKLPHDPVLLTHIMHRAYRESDLTRMGELLQLIDEQSIDDHMVWVFRGWYHLETGDLDDAEEALREALRLHPLSPLAHHESAKLLRKMQRPEAEIEREQRLAATGRELRTALLQTPTAVEASAKLLAEIQAYAEACGDEQVSQALKYRLEPLPIPFPGVP